MWRCNESGLSRDRELADLEVLLSVEQLSEVEVGDERGHIVWGLSVKGRNDSKCGNDLEVIMAFEDEWKFSAFGSDTKVCSSNVSSWQPKETSAGLTVENHVAFIIDELRSFGLQLLSFFNCGEVFVAVR